MSTAKNKNISGPDSAGPRSAINGPVRKSFTSSSLQLNWVGRLRKNKTKGDFFFMLAVV
jgi:hypothetical protein